MIVKASNQLHRKMMAKWKENDVTFLQTTARRETHSQYYTHGYPTLTNQFSGIFVANHVKSIQ